MRVEYNQLGEECNSSKKDKKMNFLCVEGAEKNINVFACKVVFTWSFMDSKRSWHVEA
jgi:hypothetical protein